MFKSLLDDFVVSEAEISYLNGGNRGDIHTNYSLYSIPGPYGAQ